MRYSNCKLNEDIINSILDKNITSAQIDVLLWLSRKQDVYGRVFDVKYYDVCNAVGISHQEFYNAIDGLIFLGFVRLINRSHKHGWDLEILGNANTGEEQVGRRYLNTNRSFLFQDIFMGLKANEKKLVLKIMLEKKQSNDFYLYYKAITKWIHVTNIQLIKSYIRSINKIFNIINNHKMGLCILKTGKINTTFDKNSEFHYFYEYRLKIMCRKLKIKYVQAKDISDTITVLHQYKQRVNIHILLTIILSSLERLKKLEPKHINWSISKYISTGKFPY